MIETGKRIFIERLVNGRAVRGLATVLEREDELLILTELDLDEPVSPAIEKGDKWSLCWRSENGETYGGRTLLLGMSQNPSPVLYMTNPDKIYKQDRRRAKRYANRMLAKVRRHDDGVSETLHQPERAMITDINVLGCRFLQGSGYGHVPGEELLLEIHFAVGRELSSARCTVRNIRRIFPDLWSYGVSFSGLSREIRDEIDSLSAISCRSGNIINSH